MDLASEVRSLQDRLLRLEDAMHHTALLQGRGRVAGGEAGSTRSLEQVVADDLRRMDLRILRLEDRWDRQDHRLALAASRIDRLEARLDERSGLLELEVRHLRDELPGIIESTIREVYREERAQEGKSL